MTLAMPPLQKATPPVIYATQATPREFHIRYRKLIRASSTSDTETYLHASSILDTETFSTESLLYSKVFLMLREHVIKIAALVLVRF